MVFALLLRYCLASPPKGPQSKCLVISYSSAACTSLELDANQAEAVVLVGFHLSPWANRDQGRRRISISPSPLHFRVHLRASNALVGRGGLQGNWCTSKFLYLKSCPGVCWADIQRTGQDASNDDFMGWLTSLYCFMYVGRGQASVREWTFKNHPRSSRVPSSIHPSSGRQ